MEYTMGESGLTDLHFCVKFKKMRGDSEAVRDLIRSRIVVDTAEELTIPAVVIEDATVPVELDDMLVYEGAMYRIVSVDQDGNTAAIVRVNSSVPVPPITIGIDVATHLVNEYILL